MRKSKHRAAQDIARRVLKREKVATLQRLLGAMERGGVPRSTFAIWNLRNAGDLKRIARGVYQYTGG